MYLMQRRSDGPAAGDFQPPSETGDTEDLETNAIRSCPWYIYIFII
jgi:hypothetical protein